jgi:hypothetical protein
MIKYNKQAINDAIGLTKAYEDGDTHIIGNTMLVRIQKETRIMMSQKSRQFYVMHPTISQH